MHACEEKLLSIIKIFMYSLMTAYIKVIYEYVTIIMLPSPRLQFMLNAKLCASYKSLYYYYYYYYYYYLAH